MNRITNRKINTLRREYEDACNAYIEVFVQKQGYEFSGWVGVGEIAGFIEQYFFNLEDIIYDIENKCAKGLIFEHQDYVLENQDKEHHINYKSYAMGARYDMIENKDSGSDVTFAERLKGFYKRLNIKL